MATETSNHYKAELHQGSIDFSSDVFKIILMATGFTFDKDAHATLSDVSASELANGNGYTTGGETLANVDTSSIENDTDDRSEISWDTVSWTASGGSIGPTPGAIIYDDTTADDTIVAYLDFGGEETIPSGTPLNINTPTIRLGDSA